MGIFAVNNFGDTRSGGLAGPMGLFIIILMCVATVLLIRNMNKRVRRLPDSFTEPRDGAGGSEPDATGADAEPPADAVDGRQDALDERQSDGTSAGSEPGAAPMPDASATATGDKEPGRG